MTDLTDVGPLEQFADQVRVVDVHGRRIAVFPQEEGFYAIDDTCPHKGASLSEGICTDGQIACPWHDWQFDLNTGDCLDHPNVSVQRYDVTVETDRLFIRIPEEENSKSDGIQRYLIRYGALGWVGYFGTIEMLSCSHRDRVLIQTDRGVEVGEVLATPADSSLLRDSETQPTGEVLRRMTSVDEQQWQDTPDEASQIFHECAAQLGSVAPGITVIDQEQLFDGLTVVLYYLGPPSEELGRLAVTLGENHRAKVVFHSVIETPPESAGVCSTNGCGNCGCG